MSRVHSIRSARHLQILTGFAMSNVLLAFDYDGTLAPIVPTPEHAPMRETTRGLLAQAAQYYPVVVISGRALDDVSRRLAEIPVWYVFGNHGLEPVAADARQSWPAGEWVRRLKEVLPDDPGIVIEDKKHSVTIHYRAARDRDAAIAAIHQAVSQLPDASVLGGKEAVNLLPKGGAHKGVALRQAITQFACDSAIYVGDDDTDEKAFAAVGPERLLSIQIGYRAGSHARYHLDAQEDIDWLLRTLVEVRRSTQRVPSRFF